MLMLVNGLHCLCARRPSSSDSSASAARPDVHAAGAEPEQPWRAVARGRRHAALSPGQHVADRAVLLQAVPEGAAPEMALVDVAAARVQAAVPAQRSHPAELPPGDLAA